MNASLPFKGVIPPLITPLADTDQLDREGLERLIEHVIAGGVHGLFLLGTSGEAPSLSHRLQRELVEVACRQIDGRVPVLVGITDTSFMESASLARFAADQGADAAVLATPHYFPMNQDDLRRYLAELVEQLPLPVMLYNMPSHTKVSYDVETVRQAMDLPQVIGVKDSSGDMLYFNRLVQLSEQRDDFSILIGPEELLAEAVLMGGHGGVSGGANLNPQLFVEIYEAAVSGDLCLIQKLHHRVLRASEAIYGVGPAPTGYLTGIKCALELMGLCSGRLAEPLYGLDEAKRETIRQHLADLGLFDLSDVSL